MAKKKYNRGFYPGMTTEEVEAEAKRQREVQQQRNEKRRKEMKAYFDNYPQKNKS